MRALLPFLVAWIILGGCGQMTAANLIDARPLTNRIILLQFDDGYVEYHGYGQTSEQDTTHSVPLDLVKAHDRASYLISSPDDPEYGTAALPDRIGRKSKGKYFSRKCRWNGSACVNDIVLEHNIYLVLPSPLRTGKSYRIDVSKLGANLPALTLVFDEARSRSEAVHVNQVGYLPASDSKHGYVSHWMGDLGGLALDDYSGAPFQLLDARTRQVVYQGSLTLRYRKDQPETGQQGETPNGNFSNADVWDCDFSDFRTPGEYLLSVQGIGCSFPFEIGAGVYREAFHLTARALYHQRSGIRREAAYTQWPAPADHHPSTNGTAIRYTTLRYMDQTSESGKKEEVYAELLPGRLANTFGWYHDAGDWDGYPTHSVIPKSLMTIYELAPDQFVDGELNLPESGNGVPDILDEAAWLVNYYRRNIGPTGGIFGSRITGDLAGGDSDGVPSWEDSREWIAFGEEPAASFDFAGMAAQLSHALRKVEMQARLAAGARRPGSRRPVSPAVSRLRLEANELLEAAKRAYSWAQANLRTGDEAKVRDLRMYAAAWLYKTSGSPEYQSQFEADNRVRANDIASFDAQRWGVWAYVTIPSDWPGLNTTLRDSLITAATAFADSDNLYAAERRSYRQGGNYWMPVLIGQATTPWVMSSIVAYELTGDPKYLRCVINTADYMLGGNPLNMTWVTGLGHRSPRQLLHLDAWYDGIPEMIPGFVPYGPHRGEHNGWTGPWDPDYARDRAVYPAVEQWPVHELYFENRYCPITNEFTVHQNIAPAAAVYGYLAGKPASWAPNRAPVVELQTPVAGTEVNVGQPIRFAVQASDPDGWIALVEYYVGRDKVGESVTAPFIHDYIPPISGSVLARAVAVDNKGRRSTSEEVVVTVR